MTARGRAVSLSTRDLVGVECFAVGVHNGHRYTGDDLDDMVAAFDDLHDRLGYDPPVKLDHDEEQPLLEDTSKDGGPAFGWVSKLYRKGSKLLADLSKVPEKLAELVEAGAYRGRSAEIWWDVEFEGKTYRRALKALALLGVKMPAVRKLKDIFKLYDGPGLSQPPSQLLSDAEGRRYQDVLYFDDGPNEGNPEELTEEELDALLLGLGKRLEPYIRNRTGAPRTRGLMGDLKDLVRRFLARGKSPSMQPPKEHAALLFKTDVNYREGERTKQCMDCRWFNHWGEGMTGACAVVEGMIMPHDTCDRFEAAPERREIRGYAEAIEGAWDAAAATQRVRKWASSDGSGANDTIDWGRYGQAFAVKGEAGSFDGFSFPHHDVQEGALRLHKGGVVAAWAAAKGARSGQVNAEAQRHLQPHRSTLGLGEEKEQEGRMGENNVTVEQFEDMRLRLVEAEAKTARLEQLEAANAAASERIAQMEQQNRLRWATDTTQNWVGDRDKNRTFLLAAVEKHGQDSDFVRTIIDREEAHATQLRESGLLTERGHSESPSTANTVLDQFEDAISKVMEGGRAKTRAEAIAMVAAAQPRLYRDYTAGVTHAAVTYPDRPE